MNKPATPRKTFAPRALAAIVAAAGIAVTAPASAARIGSTPQFPVGITMGSPTGALPPVPGLWLIDKGSFQGADSVDAYGHRTGATTTVWTNNAQLMWVPGFKVLGAQYAAFVRNLGAVNITLKTPNGLTSQHSGLPDTEIIPANLSWKVGEHLYFDAELGIYLKDGDYKNVPRRLNIGQNATTYEPNFSLSYISDQWLLSAHALFDINGWNHDAGYVNGEKVSYRNGNTFDLDYTLFRKTGHWSYGVVGYFLRQISNDKGPAELNGGKPEQYAAGVGTQYDFGKVKLMGTYTHDYHARNIGQKDMLIVYLSIKTL